MIEILQISKFQWKFKRKITENFDESFAKFPPNSHHMFSPVVWIFSMFWHFEERRNNVKKIFMKFLFFFKLDLILSLLIFFHSVWFSHPYWKYATSTAGRLVFISENCLKAAVTYAPVLSVFQQMFKENNGLVFKAKY